MNFQEWWANRLKTHFAGDEGNGLDAWNACKNEILNFLENNKHEICSHGYDAGMEYVYLDDVKEKIEKL